MKLDRETLQKIAHLARLEFDESHEEKMQEELGKIINWVEKLKELDTEKVAPITNMSSEVNAFRADSPKPHLSHERGLKNAPQKDSDYFRVPKVIE